MTLDSRITFSRASLGTYHGSDGLLKYAAHNMAWPSVGFSGWSALSSGTVTANSILAPDGTTTGAKLNHPTAGTVPGGGVNGGNVPSSDIYRRILSVYAKAGTKSWLTLANTTSGTTNVHCWFNLATGTVGTRGTNWISSGIEDVGGGWYRCWGLSGAASFLFILRVGETDNTVNCTSSGDIYVWGAQCEWVTTATTPSAYLPTTTAAVHGPRFDYDPVSHAPKGLLIEEARTNLLWTSQDFSHANWTKQGATITADNTTAPDGTTSADLITATLSSSLVNQGMNFTSAAAVASVFAKKGTSDWITMSIYVQAVDQPDAWFNLATGTVGTVESPLTAATIQDVGNGWYRCSVRRPEAGSVNERLMIALSDGNGNNSVTTGRTAYLWGAQAEQSSDTSVVASSYIPVPASSTVTRAADVATITGTNFSSWYNQAQGTFIAEFDVFSVSRVSGVLSADDGTLANQTTFYVFSDNQPVGRVRSAGATVATLASGHATTNTVGKLGISYALNDYAVCFNGGTVATDVAGQLPIALTQLRIGFDNLAATEYLSGHIRRIRFYNVAKSDAELQALTT